MTIYRDLKCHQITFEDFIFFFRADMSHIAVPLDPACHVILVVLEPRSRGHEVGQIYNFYHISHTSTTSELTIA